MDQLSRYFPWGLLVVAAVSLLLLMAPAHDGANDMHLTAASDLPVMDGGRVKPISSYARTLMMQISSRQSWRDDKGDERPATEWLFDVVTHDGQAAAMAQAEGHAAFRIESAGVRERLGLGAPSPRPPETESPYLKEKWVYTFNDLGRPATTALIEEGKHLAEVPRSQMSEDDLKIVEMFQQLVVYSKLARDATPHKVFRIENDQVLALLMLEPRPGKYRYSFGELLPRLALLDREAHRAADLPEKSRSVQDVKTMEAFRNVERYLTAVTLSGESLYVVPPAEAGGPWRRFEDADRGGPLGKLLVSYQARDAAGFNRELDDYRATLDREMPAEANRASFEAWFNHAEPFYLCTCLYFCVFLLACLAWVGWTEPLRRGAFWMMALTLAVHTFALFARMYMLNRPFVFITNLYGTAVFIGWVGGLTGLVIEVIFKNGIGAAIGALLGFLTTIIAHNLASGDTLEQVVAVLDTNFWLATHVTVVNGGYGATFVTGLLGAALIFVGVCTRALDRHAFRTLGQMLYGVLCFATLFSFVGTVLGGIWADQSWGRFWGWDPKENGALLIVLMNALILHSRWAGLVQQRGMAVLAVLGNIIVIWSWFGVNMLDVGLHTYGPFHEGAMWLWLAVAVHVAVALVGMVPMRHWRSFAALQARTPQPPSPAPATPPSGKRGRRRGAPSTAVTTG